MRPMMVIAAMVVSLFVIPLSYADTDHSDKAKQTMENKQANKDKEKKIPGGSVAEERTGGASPSGTTGAGNVKAPQHEGADKKKQ